MLTNNENSKQVTVIGLGAMGSVIAKILLDNGYKVTIWNRTINKGNELVENGAVFSSNAASAIFASPITIVCVYDYNAADNILNNQEVSSSLKDKVLIQLTTGSPQEAKNSESWVNNTGAKYLDGAIQVAPDQMAKSDTTILISGNKDAFNKSETLLKTLAGNTKYLGEKVSSAAAMDLATLSYVYGSVLGFFQGVLISEAEGFDVGLYGSIVNDIAPGFGKFIQYEAEVIKKGNYEITQSPLRISVEATERLAQTARTSGINDRFPTFVAAIFKKAMQEGYGNEEVAAVIKVMRQGSSKI